MNYRLPSTFIRHPRALLRCRTLGLGSILLTVSLLGCGGGGGSSGDPIVQTTPDPAFTSKPELGEALFNDENLSLQRTMSCSTCHNPEFAFIDDRLDDDGLVDTVSEGDDGFSLGTRNTPTAAYAAFSPDYHIGTRERVNVDKATVDDYEGPIGGQFLDGRSTDLQAQAGQPFLNEIEMMMPDEAAVVARVQEDEDLAASMRFLYGETVFDNTDTAFDAVTDAITEFEQEPEFAPFSSKYDKFINGEFDAYLLSKAALGEGLFFSQFTNCDTCHQLQSGSGTEETFSSYEYHNIGVPANSALIARKQSLGQEQATDNGLFDNTEEDADKGKFKVPTLRNVAVTAPYMHNGVFRSLDTVMRFYDQFNNPDNLLNPETGEAWADPEVEENLNLTELVDGDIMTEDDIEGLVCFLVSLTDEAFEHLVQDQMEECGLL